MSSSKNAVQFVALIALMAAAGCTRSDVQYAKAFGPRVKPLNVACPHPVPKKMGYIFTPIQVTPMWNGGWLVADGGTFNRANSKVVMFDAKGKPIWAVASGSFDFVHSAYLTTRGNVLITDTNNNRVIEVRPSDCRVVFNTDDLGPHGSGYLGRGRLSDGSQLLYPNDAKEIPNGHYLISSRLNNTVFEIDRHGHVFWKCSRFYNPFTRRMDGLAGQHNPQRLPNGNTIISDSDNARIVIVNRDCTRLKWEYTGRPVVVNGKTTYPFGRKPLKWPRDATMMRNHDILIDDSLHNRCFEVNLKHQVVRRYYDMPEPYSCWPLKNGLVASGNGNTHGIALWAPGTPQAAPVALIPPRPMKNPFGRPPSHLVNGSFETEASNCLSEDCQREGPNCVAQGGPPSGGPLGWQEDDLTWEGLPPQAKTPMSYDTSTAHCGFSSGRITWERRNPFTKRMLPHAPIWFGQVVRVFPYRFYRLTYWIKIQNVRFCAGCDFGKGTDPGKYAYMSAQLIRPTPWANPILSSFPKLSGTHDWQQFTKVFFVPQGTRFLSIQCLLTGAGTVWFDDVSLRALGKRVTPGT